MAGQEIGLERDFKVPGRLARLIFLPSHPLEIGPSIGGKLCEPPRPVGLGLESL